MLTACPLPASPAAPAGPESRRLSVPGERVGWLLARPRTCTGVWTGTTRRPCPSAAAVKADTADAQCAACARADKGRQIARDAAPDDGREYLLYLAWFGPGLVKVGLTAAGRGRDRLLEQGAISFAVLAAGPYGPVRHAEKTVSSAGLAAERVTAKAKAAAWLGLPPPRERAQALAAVRDKVADTICWPAGIQPRPGAVVDQVRDFGLSTPLPGDWREVTAISDGAVLAGTIRAVIGRRALLDTADGPLLCDMRRAAGWTIRPVPAGLTPAGLTLAASPDPGGADAHVQQAFF
ncbi:MAG: DUF2797 domain-containing protein [Trebonia sp.]